MTKPQLPRSWVYLLFSVKNGQIYLGYTTELRRRLHKHNSAENTGWTKRGQPWRLLAVRCFLDRHSAQLAERQLKRSRYGKRNWIRREHARLRKLCERFGIKHPVI